MQEKYPHLKITGLCHSVQGTARMLAEWTGTDPKDVTYTCAGVNHQAFYLDLKWNGKDMCPVLIEAMIKEEVLNAVFGDNTMFKFNGNVRNFSLIDNLPYDCCVEVPVVASKDSLEAVAVGALPEQLAVLVNTTARCEELAVQAYFEGDARKVFWACAFDPLTSAMLSLDEIQKIVTEMLEQNKDYLPWYKGYSPDMSKGRRTASFVLQY